MLDALENLLNHQDGLSDQDESEQQSEDFSKKRSIKYMLKKNWTKPLPAIELPALKQI
jgi:hypothetical protein